MSRINRACLGLGNAAWWPEDPDSRSEASYTVKLQGRLVPQQIDHPRLPAFGPILYRHVLAYGLDSLQDHL